MKKKEKPLSDKQYAKLQVKTLRDCGRLFLILAEQQEKYYAKKT